MRGEITEVTDPAELARLRGLPLRPWAPGARDHYVQDPARGADRPPDHIGLDPMGTEITREKFGERDYARFRERLEQCLSDLEKLLARPGFGVGPVTIGAELEVCLIDDAARPLPRNQAVRALAADPRIALELNRYNLELNSSPVPLAGRPFTALAGELGLLLARAGDAARAYQGRIALIGILPTLGPAHLDLGMVTDAARYRALDRGLRRLHRGPFRHPDQRRRTAGADHRARHARGGEHLVPAAPAGRPGGLHQGLQRGPAGDRPGAGRGRQLAHVPRSPALGGDQDRAVQAVGRGPRPHAARGAARPARRSAPAGCAAARSSCSPRASGCTSRCCPSSARRPPSPARRPWMSSGCTRARCGAGTGPSTTPRPGGTCGSRCAPCPPGRPSPTCWPTRPS